MTSWDTQESRSTSVKFPWPARLLCIAVILLLVLVLFINSIGHLYRMQAEQILAYQSDESCVTLALRKSESWSDFKDKIPYSKPLMSWIYLQNRLFGLETTGRKLFTAAALILCLIFLSYSLFRNELLSWRGLALLGFFFLMSALFQSYATFGLFTYTITIMFSFLSVHVILVASQQRLQMHSLILLSLLISICIMQTQRIIVGVYSLAIVVSIANFLHTKPKPRRLLSLISELAVLLLPSTIIFAYILFLHPHKDFSTHRNDLLYYYFSDSGVEQTIRGAFSFAFTRSNLLIRQAFAAHPNIFSNRSLATLLSNFWILTFFVGLVVSIVKTNSRRLVLVIYLFLGVMAHIFLSLINQYPYGNVRYFLSFFAVFPIFTVLGICDIFSLIDKAYLKKTTTVVWKKKFRRLGIQTSTTVSSRCKGVSFHRLFIILCFAVLLALQVPFIMRIKTSYDETKIAMRYFSSISQELKPLGKLAMASDWPTYLYLEDQFPAVYESNFYKINTNYRTVAAGKKASDIDKLWAWQQFTDKNDHIVIMTSIPFNARNYDVLYEMITSNFDSKLTISCEQWHLSEWIRRI